MAFKMKYKKSGFPFKKTDDEEDPYAALTQDLIDRGVAKESEIHEATLGDDPITKKDSTKISKELEKNPKKSYKSVEIKKIKAKFKDKK